MAVSDTVPARWSKLTTSQSPKTSSTRSHPVGRPLAILAHPSRTDSMSSLEANLSQGPAEATTATPLQALDVLRTTEQQPIHIPGSHSLPVTPPPELNHDAVNQLIDGVGGHFPPSLPSRASTLTMGSENGTTPQETENPDADASDLEEDLLETSRAETYTFAISSWSALPEGQILGFVDPVTPSRTPKRLRASSPHTAQRPAKRQRTQRESGHEESENEGDSEEPSKHPADNQSFRNLRRLTVSLAGSIENSVGTLGAQGRGMPGPDKPLGYNAPCTPHKGQAGEASANAHSALDLTPQDPVSDVGGKSAQDSTNGDFTMAIECFTEEEVVEHLAELLTAYRSFYLEPDQAEPQGPSDAASARRSRHIFKTIFEEQLNSAEDEAFLLQEEEEDILDAFLAWLREKRVLSEAPSETSCDTLEGLFDRLGRVGGLVIAPFIKKIVLSMKSHHGSLLFDHLSGVRNIRLSANNADGTVEWELGVGFYELAQLQRVDAQSSMTP